MIAARSLAAAVIMAVALTGCPKGPPVIPPVPKTTTGEEPAHPGPPPLERPGDPPKNAKPTPPG